MSLLLLGGTAEARRLADALADRGADAVLSLAGATRSPAASRLPVRVGGFGGEAGFRGYLAERRISAVLDATHPFAQRISQRAASVCAELGLPHLQLLRPEWTAGAGDSWVGVASEEEAARHVPRGCVVFLATGGASIGRFGNLEGCRVVCRRIDPPREPFPFKGGEYLVGRPGATAQAEGALFRRLGVDWLVARNSGGAAARAKLDAARDLGIPVAMIARPPQPDARRVASVDGAMDWLEGLWANG